MPVVGGPRKPLDFPDAGVSAGSDGANVLKKGLTGSVQGTDGGSVPSYDSPGWAKKKSLGSS